MITTITGENDYIRSREVKSRVDRFIAEHGDFECERIEGETTDVNTIEGALMSLPFFSSKKCIVLDTPSRQKEFTAKAPDILAQVADSVEVIIHEPKLDNRSRYTKYLRSATDVVQCDNVTGADLIQWLVDQIAQRGGTLSKNDAYYLVQQVGEQQFLLINEIEKLIVHNPKITRQHIDALIEPRPQSTIFELLDAAFSGAHQKALDLYQQQRLQNVEPQIILHMMARQLQIYALISYAPSGMSDQALAKDIKQHPYTVKKARQTIRHVSATTIKDFIKQLRQIDETAKTKSSDLDDLLQNYIIAVAHA